MEFDVEKMSKALAECHGGRCFDGCYLFDTAIKDEQMRCMNCLNIANEVIKKLTEDIKEKSEQIFKLENRLKECENGYEGTLFLESCKLHDAEQKVKELTEENERLRAEKEVNELLVKDLRFRNKELQKANEGFAKNCEELEIEIEGIPERCAAVKTNTVRKVCSEIKERCIKGGIYPAFVANVIARVEKELLEDTE